MIRRKPRSKKAPYKAATDAMRRLAGELLAKSPSLSGLNRRALTAIADGRRQWVSDVEWRQWFPSESSPRLSPHEGRTNLYRHYDAKGRLLYVGISLAAIERLRCHRTNSPWFGKIARIEIKAFGTRKAALAAETHAIKEERPIHNRAGAPSPRIGQTRSKYRLAAAGTALGTPQ
jgi:hypothetical protein